MSYILDALKKLEKKKLQDSLPCLMSDHSAESNMEKNRAIWPVFIIIALLLNAVIMIIWLGLWKSEDLAPPDQLLLNKNLIPSTEQVTESKTIERLDAPAEVSNQSNNAVAAKEHIEIPATTNLLKSKKVVSDNEADNITVAEDDENTIKLSIENQTSETDEIATLDFFPEKKELDTLKNKIKQELLPLKKTPESSPEVSSDVLINSEQESGDTKQVKDWSQLPESIKKDLPELTISGHIYSDNPSARIVNINGVVLREGEAVSAGLTVDEITPSGIIFTYKNERFNFRSF